MEVKLKFLGFFCEANTEIRSTQAIVFTGWILCWDKNGFHASWGIK